MPPELQNRLAELTQKLGVSAEHVWAVLVRQAALHGLYELLCAALQLLAMGALGAGYAIWWRRPAQKKEGHLDSFPFDRTFGTTLAATLLLTLGFAFVGTLYEGTSDLLNPEHYAIKRLFDR